MWSSYVCPVSTVPDYVWCFLGSWETTKVHITESSTAEYSWIAASSFDGIPVPAVYVRIYCTCCPDSVACQAYSLRRNKHWIAHQSTRSCSATEARIGRFYFRLLADLYSLTCKRNVFQSISLQFIYLFYLLVIIRFISVKTSDQKKAYIEFFKELNSCE